MAHYRLFYARIFWIFFRSTFCEHFSPDWRPRGFQWLAEFPLKLYKFREHLSNFTLLSVLHYESFDDWKISIMLYQHLKPWNEKVKVNFLIFMCINSTIFFSTTHYAFGKKNQSGKLKMSLTKLSCVLWCKVSGGQEWICGEIIFPITCFLAYNIQQY